MERGQTITIENFLANWNGDVPDYPLTAVDLKKPHTLMRALFHVFDRLGVDRDSVLAPPPEECRTESMIYYWDLLPAINMTRAINHIFSTLSQVNVTIFVTHFLQPTVSMSHALLLLLYNIMLFKEERLRDIAQYEEELFDRTNQVKALEDKKNKLLEQLNQQAEEKGKRAERLEKFNYEIKQFEEELKQEKEVHAEEKQELEAVLNENRQIEHLLEQKKSQNDAIVAEIARKKALRVYDADDVKARAEQAAQNVQEAEEMLTSLGATLMQKENSLKNLQATKPSLDTANNLLHEIMKLSDSLKELESGDLEEDSKEGEWEVLHTELAELQLQLSEISAARDEAAARRSQAAATREHERTGALGALREAEERDKKCQERCKKAIEQTEHLKRLTLMYEKQKSEGIEEINTIQNTFCEELKATDEKLFTIMSEVEKRIGEKMRERHYKM